MHSFGRAWEGEFGKLGIISPSAVAHYSPDRPARAEHVKLILVVDFAKKTLRGTCQTTVRAVREGVVRLEFDAVDLAIASVRRGRHPCGYETNGDKLIVALRNPLRRGKPETIAIDYTVTEPPAGLYFTGPDNGYPNKPLQVWSQGQDEDSRFWFPCYDFPSQKSTSEVVVTVPASFFALSNGKLLGVSQSAGTKTFHWKQTIPHSTYLITLVAGEFVEQRASVLGIPVTYYVPPGREAEGNNAFGNTPRMIRFFSDRIGVRYPYEKYSQIAVTDFVFGGMENTSATTITDLTLHDARAHLDFSSDPLISHELAHQWFGDLLTCAEWSHAWLNEGFATYFQALWREHEEGEDEFRYDLYKKKLVYFEEDAKYRRPIVTNVYEEPIDIFDRHTYEKGGLVLHMIRRYLGDELWWRSIRAYVTAYRGRSVVTHDLLRVIEETTGFSMQRFFDQWVYQAGYPELELNFNYNAEKRLGTLKVKQTQKSLVFWVPAEVQFHVQGRSQTWPIEIERPETSFHFPLAKHPDLIRFDPKSDLLARVKFQRPAAMLQEQLRSSPDAQGRIEALLALAEVASASAVQAIRRALTGDPFWGVQAEAAAALGKIKSGPALEALLEGISLPNPKARRAVVEALGDFRDERAAKALALLVEKGDPSYFVEAAAAASLGKTKAESALSVLREALHKDSWNEVIRVGVIEGLAALDRREALDSLKVWARRGKPELARHAALRAIGKIGSTIRELDRVAFDELAQYFPEREYRTRMNLISAFRSLRYPAAVSLLETWLTRRGDGRIRGAAQETIRHIRTGQDRGDDLKKLHEDLEKVSDENRKLRDRLDVLEVSKRKKKPT